MTSTTACLRTSRCIFVSPFILGTKSWHLHECRHCVCCMKLTKRSVQLAFDPAHRVFFRKKLKNFFASESGRKDISQYGSEVTRTLSAVQKGIFEERVCVFLEKAGWNGGSASTQGMEEIGVKFAQREDSGVRLGFPVFPLEGIYALSLFYFLAFGHGVSRSRTLSSWALETVQMGFWRRWSFLFWSS